jgi:hypothetical protein
VRTQLNVPLEFVEDEIIKSHLLDGQLDIEDMEFDELSGVMVITVEVDAEDATKLPWIETDYEDEIDGVPV